MPIRNPPPGCENPAEFCACGIGADKHSETYAGINALFPEFDPRQYGAFGAWQRGAHRSPQSHASKQTISQPAARGVK
jgi:hypothetical protein